MKKKIAEAIRKLTAQLKVALKTQKDNKANLLRYKKTQPEFYQLKAKSETEAINDLVEVADESVIWKSITKSGLSAKKQREALGKVSDAEDAKDVYDTLEFQLHIARANRVSANGADVNAIRDELKVFELMLKAL